MCIYSILFCFIPDPRTPNLRCTLARFECADWLQPSIQLGSGAESSIGKPHCLSNVTMGVSKNQGPPYRSETVGLLLQGHPQKGPPM